MRIGWAIYGKRPGSGDDYSVLASAGPFTREQYAVILERHALGNPIHGDASPGALPWITLTEAVGADGLRYVGISRQRWTADGDRDNRPISQTTHLCVPYTELSGAAVSYLALYDMLDQVDRIDLTDRSGRPPPLELRPYDPSALVADIVAFGFRRIAYAAAGLIGGQVTIVNAGELGPVERLRVLDCIAALLPFGWRTRLTGATWQQSGSPHIELAFADRPRPGTGTTLDWLSPTSLPTPAGPGGDYFTQLLVLVEQRGRGLNDLVHYLAEFREPLARHPVTEAIGPLADYDWPTDVVDGIATGTTTADQLRRLLGSPRLQQVAEQERQALAARLLALGGPDDLALLASTWPLTGGSATRDRLVAEARGRLWRERPEPRVVEYLTTAAGLGLPEVIPLVLRVPESPPPPATAPIVARLLRRFLTPKDPAAPRTLRDAGYAAVTELILQLTAERPADLDAWFTVLLQAWEELVRPFAALDRDGGRPPSPADLTALAGLAPRCVVALLRQADRHGLPEVFEAFAAWLMDGRDPDRTAWARRLAVLRPARAMSQGRLDALLLWLGHHPVHLAACIDRDGYSDAITAMLRGERFHPAASRLQTTMIAFVNTLGWAQDQYQVPLVLDVTTALNGLPGEDWSLLARTVVEASAKVPYLGEHPAYAQWWERTRLHHPVIEADFGLIVLSALPAAANHQAIAKAIADAIAQHHPMEYVVRQLITGNPDVSGRVLASVIMELNWALRARYGENRAKNLTVDFYKATMTMARELGHEAAAEIAGEARFAALLLYNALGKEDLRMTERTFDRLGLLRDDLKFMLSRRTTIIRREGK